MGRIVRVAVLAAVIALCASGTAAAQLPIPTVVPTVVPTPPTSPAGPEPQPFQANDGLGFHDVLPPGTRGLYDGAELGAFLTAGKTVPHCCDQLGMYGDLVYATPGLSAADIPKYFKDSSFGVRPGDEERRYSPRADVTIVRDKGFGVPHIYGSTRDGAMFGLGYAGAEDRLFLMDVLRHAGRGELSGFAGGSNVAQDREQWELAPYTEADLERQADQLPQYLGPHRGDDPHRCRQLRRRHQPVHHRGQARPEQDARRVRRDRASAGPRSLEAHRPDRHGVAGRRHLRQGRRQGDRVHRDLPGPRPALQDQARDPDLLGLPLGRGPRGADDGARAQALPLPG